MAGYVALSGVVSALDILTGGLTNSALQAEWNRKIAAGDPVPQKTYLMLLNQVVTADSQTTMANLAGWEVTGTGYARQPITFSPADGPTRTIANRDLIQFGPFADPTGLGSAVAAAALVTTPVGNLGLCLMWWALPSPITTVQNQSLQITAASMTMTVATS